MFSGMKKFWFVSKALLVLETGTGVKISPLDPHYDWAAEYLEGCRQRGMTPVQAAASFFTNKVSPADSGE